MQHEAGKKTLGQKVNIFGGRLQASTGPAFTNARNLH